MFLNSSGGIVTPVNSRYDWPMDVAPYFETVRLPVLTVDSSAPYGDHPENLVTSVTSNAAALTFFVDSVPGGNDSSGNGSYDHPWRSLKRADEFLSCARCMLTTAAPYIQVKVKGTVDSLSGGGGYLSVLPTHLILTGWDGRCDLSLSDSITYGAEYIFSAKVNTSQFNRTVFSDCALLHCGTSGFASAVDCEILPHSAYSEEHLGCAYNCSGARIAARICWGGSCGSAWAHHIYGTSIHASGAATTSNVLLCYVGDMFWGWGGPCTIVSANISAALSAAVHDSNGWFGVVVSGGTSSFFRDCNVDITAVGSGQPREQIGARVIGARVVSGGTYKLCALASASNSDAYSADAYAYAHAYLFDDDTAAQGIVTVLSASAGATITAPNGSAVSEERIEMFGSGCSRAESRIHYNGSVSVIHSSGGVCP